MVQMNISKFPFKKNFARNNIFGMSIDVTGKQL